MGKLTSKTRYKKLLLTLACVILMVPIAQASHIKHEKKTKKSKDFNANLVGILGYKSLDNSWQEFDSQAAIGVSFDFKNHSWPFSLTVSSIFSADVESNNASFVEEEAGTTSETHFGIRKIFSIAGSSMEPYIGGGLALVSAALDRRVNSSFFVTTDDDSATGYWVGGGIYWHLSKRFIMGVDVRYSDAEVTLFGVDREAGGLYTNMLIGTHW